MEYGREINEKLDILGQHSATTEGVTRLYLSPEHRSALDLLRKWMEEAGLTTELDHAGNLIGTYTADEGAKTLIMGSHQDSVRMGGKYDGALGIVLPLVCAEKLIKNRQMTCNLKLVAFGDEEGVRFKTTYLGSMAFNGHLPEALLDRRDDGGQTLREALVQFGCNPELVNHSTKLAADGYIEVHIEQGPVLETNNLPVGIVTSIQSSYRYQVTIQGVAGHAGTVPMAYRQDASIVMAEAMIKLREIAMASSDLVATVGEISISPGAVNVIPGEVVFSIDIRSPQEACIVAAISEFEEQLHCICAEHRTSFDIVEVNHIPATTCDQEMVQQLSLATEAVGLPQFYLASGAGHDAQEMKTVSPIGMLFVRNREGISHNPLEFVSVEDMETAAQIVTSLMKNFK